MSASGVNNIYDDYEAGEDCQRTAVMETTAFGASTVAGAWVGTAVVSSMLGVSMFATPVGWIFAIGIGLAAGYAAAKVSGSLGKALRKIYDTSSRLSSL